MSLKEEIAQFSTYFSDRIAEVEKVEHGLFRKILFMGIIDTLSRAGCSAVKSHRERVIQFIDNCSGWKDKDCVSSQQLILNLEDKNKKSGALYQLAKKKVDAWPYGSIIRPHDDLSLQDADSVAAVDEKRLVRDATYKQLLYTYRNHLVHEFREPGYGMELSQDPSTPYYHGMSGAPWQLVFTDAFIKGKCVGCLNGLVRQMRMQQKNPYDYYEFESLWRRK
jgi:hypothetical protein